MGTIYKITCHITNKSYVGKTKRDLDIRIREHKRDRKKAKPGSIDAEIQEYGWDGNFTVTVLETCPVEMLDEREIFQIREQNTKAPNGYNLTDGGEGLVNPSEETRARMSANRPDVSGEKNPNYGKKTPPEVCAKISAAQKGRPSPFKGKKRSPEFCAKISATHADVSGENNPRYGKPCSPETRAKIAAAHRGKPSPRKGKKLSPETRARISAACKGRPSPRKGKKHTDESKAKISAAKTGKPGKPHTEEAKAKISAALKAYWARKKLESQNHS